MSSSLNLEPHLAKLAELGPEGRKLRKLHPDSIEAMKDGGLFLSLLPKKLGGLELDPREFFAAQSLLAEQDMSTGWVGGIIAVHAYQIALMDEKAQQEVYGDDPNTRVSSSYNPMGAKAEVCDGGFMFSGRWGWSSGSDHCSWVLLGGIIPGEGYRTFLIPRSDYEIEDTWFPMGLHGTGSNDIVIDKPVFVPDHRTHKQMDGFACKHNQESPYYNIPWAQIFIRVVCTPAIGAAKHALKLFIENAGGSSTDPTKLMTDPDIQNRVAQVANMIDEVEAVMDRNFAAQVEAAQNGGQVDLVDRVRSRYQAGLVIDKMNTAINTLFDVAGGRSVFQGAPIQDIWNDIHIARAHVANNPAGFARNYGGVLLGGESADPFV